MGWQTIVKENNLDISIVNSIDLNEELRIDAEYHKPKYLREETALLKLSRMSIGEFCFVTDGQHGYHEEDENSDIRFLTAKNAKDFFADGENVVRVAQWVDDKNKRSSLQPKDLILSTRGTVGLCAIVGDEILPAQIDQDVARICISDDEDVSPEFFLTYLNCSFGQDWMIRNATGNVQQGLSLDKVRKIPVPILPRNFQTRVSGLIVEAKAKTQSSVFANKEAEKLLLKEINLEGYAPSEENTSVRELTECLADNRFDAEYWEPRFDEILARIKSYKAGCSTINDEFLQIKNGFKSDPETLYRYVEIGDVNVSTGEVSSTELEGKELPANAKITLEEKQLVTSKVRPNRGATAILDNHKGYIASGAFVVLKETGEVTLETLQVYLKSPFIRDLLLRYNTGTAYPTIVDTDILNLPLPLVDKGVQEAITEKIKQCSKERTEARELLGKAKRAVEIFIEKDEQEALKYLAP